MWSLPWSHLWPCISNYWHSHFSPSFLIWSWYLSSMPYSLILKEQQESQSWKRHESLFGLSSLLRVRQSRKPCIQITWGVYSTCRFPELKVTSWIRISGMGPRKQDVHQTMGGSYTQTSSRTVDLLWPTTQPRDCCFPCFPGKSPGSLHHMILIYPFLALPSWAVWGSPFEDL